MGVDFFQQLIEDKKRKVEDLIDKRVLIPINYFCYSPIGFSNFFDRIEYTDKYNCAEFPVDFMGASVNLVMVNEYNIHEYKSDTIVIIPFVTRISKLDELCREMFRCATDNAVILDVDFDKKACKNNCLMPVWEWNEEKDYCKIGLGICDIRKIKSKKRVTMTKYKL